MRFDPRRFATPILATDLADLAFLALRKRLSGVWHVAGAERVSQYRFAQELAAALGMRDCPIAAGEEPPDPPSETAETSLDSRRASRALGRSMPALREGLTRFVEQATSGFRNRLRGQLLADAA
jgi:dTDP-4-dehydrorhamnose reductase